MPTVLWRGRYMAHIIIDKRKTTKRRSMAMYRMISRALASASRASTRARSDDRRYDSGEEEEEEVVSQSKAHIESLAEAAAS